MGTRESAAFPWLAAAMLAALAACSVGGSNGPDYKINLESSNIDYAIGARESRLDFMQKDIERKKGESEWVFEPKKKYEIAGVIIGWQGIDQEEVGVLGGSGGIVWGKPAIELALHSGGTPDKSSLSDEAKAVLAHYGCPAGYLTKHTVSLMAIGATDEINEKLRALREDDGVYMKGMTVRTKSANYKGQKINFNPPVTMLYVTELRLGEDTFRAP